jgi:hypothetical protein
MTLTAMKRIAAVSRPMTARVRRDIVLNPPW